MAIMKKQITILTFKQIKMKIQHEIRGGIPHTALQLNVSEVRNHPGKLSGATSSSKIEEVNLVYLKMRRYMTKLIVKLKIALAVLGIISMSVDIVVNLKGIRVFEGTTSVDNLISLFES